MVVKETEGALRMESKLSFHKLAEMFSDSW
jgi:hypothetical protein